MTYVSEWERLPDAVRWVVETLGLSKDEVQTDMCRAIFDGAIKVRAQLKNHATNGFTARGTVLEGADFQIEAFTRNDIDWERSRPRKPWLVRRERFRQPGYWELALLMVSRTDVRTVFCAAGQPAETARLSDERAVTSPSRKQAPVGPAAGSARRRGARPKKFERVCDAMRSDIQQGRRTVAELATMLEKNLSETYGVSRDTARKARRAVLSELGMT
jgi:hypothetical protein